MAVAEPKRFRKCFFAAAIILSTVLPATYFLVWNSELIATSRVWYAKVTHNNSVTSAIESVTSEFNDLKWGFELELPDYDLPKIDSNLIEASAVNWRGEGHETFATLYASRHAAMDDPYFLAVQQIIYRLLWRPQSKTRRHTVTVFVLPFVSQEQRDYFTAAGALVREVPEEIYHPDTPGAIPGRWRDMFSKLDMWSHTEFSKIAYLDSDAFPLSNIDSIFEVAKTQRCKEELLPPPDQGVGFGDYIFAGWHDGISVNAGVLVFNPHALMHKRLIRESHNHTKFDRGEMEQSLLNFAFRLDGPFPYQTFSRLYNGGTDTVEDGSRPVEEEYIIHHKLWNTQWTPESQWYKNIFNDTWLEMLEFYQTEGFRSRRLGRELKTTDDNNDNLRAGGLFD